MLSLYKEKINQFIPIGAGFLLAISILFLHFTAGEKLVSGDIVIGIPDDAGGLVVNYLAGEKQSSVKKHEMFGAYSFKDCCTSTAEWALSGEMLHMAVVCPDAAERLILSDSRYEVWGPVAANTDVLVLRPGVKPKKIGITQNRWYQKEIVEDYFGAQCETAPMLSTALPYAYEKGYVDGVVVDITNGIHLRGDFLPGKIQGEDTVTYVLVVRKNMVNMPEVQELLVLWQDAVKELEAFDRLEYAISFYLESSERKDAYLWEKMEVTYLPPVKKAK